MNEQQTVNINYWKSLVRSYNDNYNNLASKILKDINISFTITINSKIKERYYEAIKLLKVTKDNINIFINVDNSQLSPLQLTEQVCQNDDIENKSIELTSLNKVLKLIENTLTNYYYFSAGYKHSK